MKRNTRARIVAGLLAFGLVYLSWGLRKAGRSIELEESNGRKAYRLAV